MILSKNEQGKVRNFLKSFEHNIHVQEKLVKCKNSKDFIFIAKKYGYYIKLEDLNYNQTASKFEHWYRESRINRLK